MFTAERNGHTFEFTCGPKGAVIRTAGPDEKPRVLDLEGRFPLGLYKRLVDAIQPGASVYGAAVFGLPLQVVKPSLMVRPGGEGTDETRFVNVFWFVPPVGAELATRFTLDLRVSEVKKLLRYIQQHMTC